MKFAELRCVLSEGAEVAVTCTTPPTPSVAGPWDFGWIHVVGIIAVVATLLTLGQKFKADKASQLWDRIEWSLDRAANDGHVRTLALTHVAGLLEERPASKVRAALSKLGIKTRPYKYALSPVDVETLRLAGELYVDGDLDNASVEEELTRLESVATSEPKDDAQ